MSIEADLLLDEVKQHGFDGMAPARRKLADILRFIADQAEPQPAKPKAGVLADLNRGARVEIAGDGARLRLAALGQ